MKTSSIIEETRPDMEAYAMYLGNTRDSELVDKIVEICEPILFDILSNHREKLGKFIPGFSFEAYLRTNALKLADEIIDKNTEKYEEIWRVNKVFFENKGYTEPNYWNCLQWVPAQAMTQFFLSHRSAISRPY